MTEDIQPAVVVWVALIAAALAADVVLLRNGKASLSHVAGLPAGRAVRQFLDGHFEGTLLFDPLSIAARYFRRNP